MSGADTFRFDHRISLARALVLLSIRCEQWKRPEGSQHWCRLMDYFRRKVQASVQRGPLMSLRIGANARESTWQNLAVTCYQPNRYSMPFWMAVALTALSIRIYWPVVRRYNAGSAGYEITPIVINATRALHRSFSGFRF